MFNLFYVFNPSFVANALAEDTSAFSLKLTVVASDFPVDVGPVMNRVRSLEVEQRHVHLWKLLEN